MTALLEKTYGLATVYGYAEDRHSITLRTEDGEEISLFDLSLDRLREEVIEDYQFAGWLAWQHLGAPAQDRLLHEVEEDFPTGQIGEGFAREAAEYMALDGIIAFRDLTPLFQSQVDAEVRRRWEEG